MPGAVARTSTFALTNATYPFIETLAKHGVQQAMLMDQHLRNGLSVYQGVLTSSPVAKAQNIDYSPAEDIIMA